MIGQEQLIKRIDDEIERGVYPKFSILIGDAGTGKRTLARHIKEQLNCVDLLEFENSVASVREAIKKAYKSTQRSVFLFADADTMSNAAKNALLKITEEPPKNVWFIMTLQNETNTLETILSRGTRYRIDPYTSLEISMYALDTIKPATKEELEIIQWVCNTPGDVNKLAQVGVTELWGYANKVYSNIAEVSGANAFKIAEKIALKDDKGFDLKLFWLMFNKICMMEIDKVITNDNEQDKAFVKQTIKAVEITCNSLNELRISGINKVGLFDLWLLDVRKAWL